ncbi:MAG TPA: MBL fold metallo-hydrolase [Polyangiaceae bacterium]
MQIAPNVHALRIPFVVPVAPGVALERFVYAYVLLGERTWLIDTGVKGSDSSILQFVAELGRNPESIERILLTHSHIDHIGGAPALVAQTGAKTQGHAAERRWFEDVELQARERPVPGFFQLVDTSVKLDDELEDELRLELAPQFHLRVIHAPGHSPGGCAFLHEEEGVLFTGDAVPVVGDMPVYDDPLLSAASIAKLRELPDVETIASAWDEPRSGDEVAHVLDAGAALLEAIHSAVREEPPPSSDIERQAFCSAILGRVGLAPAMANPMVLRTFLSHLAYSDRPTLGG